MDELIREMARLGATGVMCAVIALVMWYLLTKMIPAIQDKHDKVLIKFQEEHNKVLEAQRERNIDSLKQLEERRVQDDERCERHHIRITEIMERIAIRLEEMSYTLDMVPKDRPHRGPGTKGKPPGKDI